MSIPFKLLAPQDVLESFYANVQRSKTIHMVMRDIEGVIVAANRATAQLFGKTPEQLVGLNWFELAISEASRVEARAVFAQLLATGLPEVNQNVITLPDRSQRTMLWSHSLMHSTEKLTGVVSFGIDITEQSRANEVLKQQQQLLSRAESMAGLGTYVLDVVTGMWVSSAVLDGIFGITDVYPRTVRGWLDIVHPEDRNMMSDYFSSHVLTQHQLFDKTYRIIRKSDGAIRSVHGFGELDIDADGKVLRMLGTIQDVTDMLAMKSELSQAEERFRLAAQHTGMLVYDWNITENSLAWEGSLRELTGYEPANFPAVTIAGWAELIHPDDRNATLALLDKAQHEKTPYNARYRFRTKNGSYILVDDSGSFITDSNGTVVRMVGTMRDLMDVQGEQRKQDELKHIGEIITSMTEAFAEHEIMYDANGRAIDYRFVTVNPAFSMTLGKSTSEIVGKTVRQLLPEIEQSWIDRYAEVVRSGVSATFSSRAKSLGKTFNVHAWRSAPGRFAVVFSDVSDMERKMRSISAILDKSPEDVVVISPDGICKYANNSSMFGYTPAEVVGTNQLRLVHPDDLPLVEEAIRALATEPESTRKAKFRIQHKNGTWRVVESVAINLLGDPLIDGLLIFSRDVTDVLAGQQAIARNEELESLNKAMIGRELRINELKEQVRLLTEQLSKLKAS